MIVTLTFNPSLDRTFHAERVRLGEVNRMTSTSSEPAGKGVNVTRALVRNGVESIAILPVGGAAGRELTRLLTVAEVPFVPVPISQPVRANVSVVEDDGTVTKLNEPGPHLDESEWRSLVDAAIEICDAGDWLAVSGSTPSGVPLAVYEEIAGRTRTLGINLAVDTSGPALSECFAARPTLAKPNLEELIELVGTELSTLGEVVEAVQNELATGPDRVLVSLGAEGAVAITRDGVVHGKLAEVQVVNTVGAGDALLAGFLAGGGDQVTGLSTALAFSAAAIRSPHTVGEPVSEEDRNAVRLSTTVEADQELSG